MEFAPRLVLLSFYPMGDMSHLAANSPVDLEQLRTRLVRMTNAELLRFGKAARFMCTPQANIGKPPRPEFVIQLEQAREEWKRRKSVLEPLRCDLCAILPRRTMRERGK
jgi:hypothetical protein